MGIGSVIPYQGWLRRGYASRYPIRMSLGMCLDTWLKVVLFLIKDSFNGFRMLRAILAHKEEVQHALLLAFPLFVFCLLFEVHLVSIPLSRISSCHFIFMAAVSLSTYILTRHIFPSCLHRSLDLSVNTAVSLLY